MHQVSAVGHNIDMTAQSEHDTRSRSASSQASHSEDRFLYNGCNFYVFRTNQFVFLRADRSVISREDTEEYGQLAALGSGERNQRSFCYCTGHEQLCKVSLNGYHSVHTDSHDKKGQKHYGENDMSTHLYSLPLCFKCSKILRQPRDNGTCSEQRSK